MTMNHTAGPKAGSVYDEEIAGDELIHWGRKGMKWGVQKEYSKETQSKISAATAAKRASDKADDDFSAYDDKLSMKKSRDVTADEWKTYDDHLAATISAGRQAKKLAKVAQKAKSALLTASILVGVGVAVVSARNDMKRFDAAIKEMSKPDPRVAEITAKVARLPPIQRTGKGTVIHPPAPRN